VTKLGIEQVIKKIKIFL